MKTKQKFDPWYKSLWVWMWIAAIPAGIILGIIANW